jgi:glycerol-3-phosphate O-acyltransferase
VRLVPVSIFVGRAPDKQSGWFAVLFSENWVIVGRFRRLLALLLNGRDTIVRFAAPIPLREPWPRPGARAHGAQAARCCAAISAASANR